MSTRATVFTPELLDYLRRISEAEPPVLQRLRERTAGHRMGKMHLAAEQAQLLAFLVQLIRTERAGKWTYCFYQSESMAEFSSYLNSNF